MSTPAPLLRSFWVGAYPGADHVNGAGQALDPARATGHDERLDADYRRARRLGLSCVRESIGWRLCEATGGTWDLTRAVRMAEAARRQGVQILWTLMHHGMPADLTLLDDALVPRFARFAGEVARVLRPLCTGPRIYTPIHEIGTLAWAAGTADGIGPAGLQAQGAPLDSSISGYRLKQRLVRAALAGMAAIRAADPEARFLHVEPVVHVTARDDDPEQRALARRIAAYQWQVLDMLCGRMDPGLGGHAEALDWLGLTHHADSQWEVPGEQRLAWQGRDPRRQPLSALLGEVGRRYRRPMLLAGSSHHGVDRAAWLHEIAGEARRARAAGVPLEGVCIDPLLDPPDRSGAQAWHREGLWHLPQPGSRCLNRPYARALSAWRHLPGALDASDAAKAAASPRSGMLLLLPCAWEHWRAPREPLLQALAGERPLRLLEPPRANAAEPLLRGHALAPNAELLVLHGAAAGGWATAPTPEQLALLRGALQQDGPRRWVCWLAGWRGDNHAAWWRELAGAGLILQADPLVPPGGQLLRRARAMLPALWPEPCGRLRLRPHSYEAVEAARRLQGIPAPRLWLVAPPTLDAAAARRLHDLAAARPGHQCMVDAPAPPDSLAGPPNLHWLGAVHDSLHAGLVAQVQRIVPWGGPPGWAGLDDGPLATREPASLRALPFAALKAEALPPFLPPPDLAQHAGA